MGVYIKIAYLINSHIKTLNFYGFFFFFGANLRIILSGNQFLILTELWSDFKEIDTRTPLGLQ